MIVVVVCAFFPVLLLGCDVGFGMQFLILRMATKSPLPIILLLAFLAAKGEDVS